MFRTIFSDHQNTKSQCYRTKDTAIAAAKFVKKDSPYFGLCVYDEKLRELVWIASTEDFQSIHMYLPDDIVDNLDNSQ